MSDTTAQVPVSAIVRMNLAAMDTADLKLMRGALLLNRIGEDFPADRKQQHDALLAAVQDEIDQRRADAPAAVAGRDAAGGDR